MIDSKASQEVKTIDTPKSQPTLSLNPRKSNDVDYMKLRCPYCYHNKAYKYLNIRNIKDSHWYCENCDKMIK